MALLLIYNISGRELKKLKQLCAGKSIRARLVAPSEYGEKLGALCGRLPRKGAQAVMNDIGEMLIFADFGENQLDMLLSELDTARICKTAIKASLTPYNAVWDSIRLWTELCRERDEMEGRTQ